VNFQVIESEAFVAIMSEDEINAVREEPERLTLRTREAARA